MFNYLIHTYLDKLYTLRPTVHYSGQAVQQKRLKINEKKFFFGIGVILCRVNFNGT